MLESVNPPRNSISNLLWIFNHLRIISNKFFVDTLLFMFEWWIQALKYKITCKTQRKFKFESSFIDSKEKCTLEKICKDNN